MHAGATPDHLDGGAGAKQLSRPADGHRLRQSARTSAIAHVAALQWWSQNGLMAAPGRGGKPRQLRTCAFAQPNDAHTFWTCASRQVSRLQPEAQS